MADKTCSIAGCKRPAKDRAYFTNDEGEKVIDLDLCEVHGPIIQRTYFPDSNTTKTEPTK